MAVTGDDSAYANRVPKPTKGSHSFDALRGVLSNHRYGWANLISELVAERAKECF